QAECHVLEYRHVAEQRVVLEDESDLTMPYIDIGGVLPAEQHAARIGRLQSCNDSQQGGLAAARRTQQGDKFTGFDIQGHIVQRTEAAEAASEVSDFNTHDWGSIRPWPAWPAGLRRPIVRLAAPRVRGHAIRSGV